MHGTFVGTLVCSSGGSAKDSDATNKTATGTTAAIDLSGIPAGALLFAQGDVAFRLAQGTTPTAVNAPGVAYGPKVDVGQLYQFKYAGAGIAAIPASGSGNAAIDLWRAVEAH